MFNLPPVSQYRLTKAPLAQALVQVRFPLQARLASLGGIAAVQEALADRYPYLNQQQVQAVEVQFGPDGPQAAAMNGTEFRFSGDDGYEVTIAPDTVSLSVGSSYSGFNDFDQRFDELLLALTAAVKVPRCDRLGVRYLSIAPIPATDPSAWTRWFRPEILGWAGSEIVSPATTLLSAINQVHFKSPPSAELAALHADTQTVIRHGVVPRGSFIPGVPPVTTTEDAYIFDLDVFVVEPQVWNAKQLGDQLVALHEQIDRFFRWTLSPVGEDVFGLQEIE